MDPLAYFLDLLVFAGIYMLLALSLNLEYGFTGLGNFGKVAFFMVGAYTYAVSIESGMPFYLALLLAAFISSVFGALVSLPALRLREDYLAIATIAFGEVLRLVVKAERSIAGGVWGIQVPSIFRGLELSTRMSIIINMMLVFAFVAATYFILQLIANSPYGRVQRSIREDDPAVSVLGKNVILYKVQAFMMGSAIAGISGGLFAQYIRFIEPEMFLPLVTFLVWIMLIMGGSGNNLGVIVGALLIELFRRGTRLLNDYVDLPVDPHNLQYVIFGVLIILIIMYRPNGLIEERPLKISMGKVAGYDNT